MEKSLKRDVIDFYHDLMAGRFDCLMIKTEKENKVTHRSIVYYTARIAVEVDPITNITTRRFVRQEHTLLTSKNNPDIDEELDIWDTYRVLVELLKRNNFVTIELVSPAVVINRQNIKTDANGEKMIYSESKKKLIEKSIKLVREAKVTKPIIKLDCEDDILVVFDDGLILEHKHNQPTKIGTFLFDREPKISEEQKIKDAEFYYKKQRALEKAEQKEKHEKQNPFKNLTKFIEKGKIKQNQSNEQQQTDNQSQEAENVK